METKTSLFSKPLGLFLNCEVEDGFVKRLFVTEEPAYQEVGDPVLRKMEEYLSGGEVDISGIPIKMKGTAFQKRVWEALREIPRGKVASYSDIARRIGKPEAARAVGNAVGSNHLLLLVPCHRVVAKSGLGGFSATGGVETKKKILDIER